jgi:hypothetical protein
VTTIRVFFIVCVAALLAACATAPPRVEESELAQLAAEKSGIGLIYVTVNGLPPGSVHLVIARPLETGGYRIMHGTPPTSAMSIPVQFKLPAGEYGIVELHARDNEGGRLHIRQYVGELGQGEFLNPRPLYARPIAKFRISPGEVVDLGTLRITRRMIDRNSVFPKTAFAATAAPTPEPVLRNLEARNPHLSKARVARPLEVLGPAS